MSVQSKRVVLITGASGGIGSDTVSLFHENGWEVIAVDHRSGPVVEMSITVDLADANAFESLGTRVRARFARVDAIVNNAAEQITKPLVYTPPAEWDRVMATNVRSLYLLAAGLYAELQAGKGAIVNVASVHAVATSPGMASYVASKGAVVALTRAMALEFASDGIRVNAVLPGAIDTPMLAAGLSRADGIKSSSMETLAARHPLGRIGKPRDVAEAIYFLADSSRSSFITGQTLIVDGGATARLSTE